MELIHTILATTHIRQDTKSVLGKIQTIARNIKMKSRATSLTVEDKP
jgi:hypothetical protein